ncbi:syntaxin 8 [Cryptococcus gattii E566]|nr:syntaxin 8 [Cryptococcus gattii E566]
MMTARPVLNNVNTNPSIHLSTTNNHLISFAGAFTHSLAQPQAFPILHSANQLENTGLVLGGKKGKTKGGDEGDEEVKQLEERYDRLLGMLEEDDLGREKAKDLKRTSQIPPSPIASPQPEKLSSPAEASPPAQDVPTFSIEPPTPAIGHQPFKDYPEDDEPELTPHEMLSNQQMLMNDQDERLNLLSHSIGRQNDLSLQIGSELDLHHQLLEETDTAMDRTAASLGRAKRRLDRVANEAKQHGKLGFGCPPDWENANIFIS